MRGVPRAGGADGGLVEHAAGKKFASTWLVRNQWFELGRDVLVDPIQNVHTEIVNGDTELGKAGMVFKDGRLSLDWERIGHGDRQRTMRLKRVEKLDPRFFARSQTTVEGTPSLQVN